MDFPFYVKENAVEKGSRLSFKILCFTAVKSRGDMKDWAIVPNNLKIDSGLLYLKNIYPQKIHFQ